MESTRAVEDYAKAIYKIGERGHTVKTTALARALHVKPASVTGMLRKLSDLDLIHYRRYRSIELSERGRTVALRVIRHHRLIETFLATMLGLPWDRVHEEAERLEHVISADLENRIDAALGYPTHDPHGDPIPAPDGSLPSTSQTALLGLAAGRHARVVRVSDHDPELLRYLAAWGVVPGAAVDVAGVEPYDGPIRIRVAGRPGTADVGRGAARFVFVELDPPAPGGGA